MAREGPARCRFQHLERSRDFGRARVQLALFQRALVLVSPALSHALLSPLPRPPGAAVQIQ
ncbi:MAG: hypothetical protein AAFQ11_07215, partial [Pseudomonadota bacterium]